MEKVILILINLLNDLHNDCIPMRNPNLCFLDGSNDKRSEKFLTYVQMILFVQVKGLKAFLFRTVLNVKIRANRGAKLRQTAKDT